MTMAGTPSVETLATVLVFAIALPGAMVCAESSPSTFKAAVYEHIPHMLPDQTKVVTREDALGSMEVNLAVYRTQTTEAKKQGADIIVFPEDGIYGYDFTRKSVFPFLEEIPDPEGVQWSPCDEPTSFPHTEVQHELSCMAKNNSIYLVANMGDRVPCNSSVDPHCPSDGHYQYNTDVAYGPDGKLLAKYHKTHLFYEDQFDTPKAKVVHFDTPFGRVGMVVCFDLLFKDPAVTLTLDPNVTIIAYPTAWLDYQPVITAIGYHSSFARGRGLHILAANAHSPKHRAYGSGIYTPSGMASFYYNDIPGSPGKLLVSSLDVLQRRPEKENELVHLKNKTLNENEEFKSRVLGDVYNLRLLEGSSGKLDVCQGHVCCSLTYDLNEDFNVTKDMFAFGAFDGLHTIKFTAYLQMCTLVKCARNDDKYTCGSPTNSSSTVFKSFTMSGEFQTAFVYPQVILSNNSQLVLPNKTAWSFSNSTIQASGPGLDTPLLSSTLFGRYYALDGISKTTNDPRSTSPLTPATTTHHNGVCPSVHLGDTIIMSAFISMILALIV